MPATVSERARALLRDDAGDGFADYSVLLGLFTIQCVCGALALNHHIEDIVHSIRAVLG